MLDHLPPWDYLLKRILFAQLDDLCGHRILDFGSGDGVTAAHFAACNHVTAIEPDKAAIAHRCTSHPYCQLHGSIETLRQMADSTFDVVFCHNVLEYVNDRNDILREFQRILVPGGMLSIVKHNRPGRVMQMAVLLDNFASANALLDGKNGAASKYGTIQYYETDDLLSVCPMLSVERIRGIRCFWDLQQQQEKHTDPAWQEQMIALEQRVSELPPYRDIAFFHHVTLRKNRHSAGSVWE